MTEETNVTTTPMQPVSLPKNKPNGALSIDDGLDLACARAWLDMDESVSQIDPYIVGGATCNCFLLSVADCADTEKEVAA